MDKITIERMRPIRDEIYLSIRKAIMRGVFKPGERLQEEQLAREMGTSRTPVREALRKLEVEKLVVHYPHKGTVVAELPIDEVEDLYEIRTAVEIIIAKRAAMNATPEDIEQLEKILDAEEHTTDPDEISNYIDEYNGAISHIANCPSIADVNTKVREVLSRMIINGHLRPDRRSIAQKEHRGIVAALAKNDPELAMKLTEEHLNNASKIIDFMDDVFKS